MGSAVFVSLLLASASLLQVVRATTQVWDVQPRYGSIAGGTLLTVSGSELISDTYSSSASVTVGDIPCIVNWYTVGPSMIQCVTQPYPFAEEGRSSAWMRVWVTINGTLYNSRRNFLYHYNSYTPRVRRVVPPAVPVGSVIAIGGERLDNSAAYTRIFVGDQICDTRDPNTNEFYGFYNDDGLNWVRCRVTQVIPGVYNVTVNLPSIRGTSWNHSQSLIHGPNNNLAMLELFPDVHSVSQHAGSTEGSTELVISGVGFDVDESQVEVDVDGIPCQMLTATSTRITCRTGKPPEDHLSIAGVNYSYPHVQDGYRFKGSRGVSIEQYMGISGTSVNNLKSSAKFPDHPDSFLTFPVFQPIDAYRHDNYGERYTAFYTPLFSGAQRLYLASDDNGELSISYSSNISEVATIATVSGYNTWYSDRIRWSDWRRYNEDQRSETLDLYTNSSYLLVGLVKEGVAADFLRVAAHYPRAMYRYNETQQAMREEQYYRFETDLQYESQMLMYTTNLTLLSNSVPPAVIIRWGGRETEPIAFDEITVADIVRTKVLDIFNASCDYGREPGINLYTDEVYDFELGIGSTDTWPRFQGGDDPAVVEYEPFCGRYSLEIQSGGAKAFDYNVQNDENGFEVEDYPQLCMAYKIPQGVQVDFAVDVRVERSSSSQWYYVEMTGGSAELREPRLTSAVEITADDRWHYVCQDLQDIFHGINPNISDYTVLGFALVPYQSELPIYIDEVSFTEYSRTVPQRTPPARPGGQSVFDVRVDVEESLSDDELERTVVVGMEFLPSHCTFDVPLMEVRVDVDEDHTNVSISRVHVASESVSGSYTLGFNGHLTRPLAHDASFGEVKAALEEDIPDIGTMTVWTNWLSVDSVRRYCPGRTVTVRFETLPGDLPMLDVNISNLTGSGLELSQRETWQGGIFLAPIPGYLLQTVEKTPQVHVRVRGQLAACSGGRPLYSSSPVKEDPCRFIYSPDHTPSVVSVVPDTITEGTVVTLMGDSFGDEPEVQFDDIECAVSNYSDNWITCTAGYGTVGPKHVQVLTSTGYAAAGMVNYTVRVSSVTPSSSSLGGGIVVSISGSGFTASPDTCGSGCSDTTMVTVGGEICVILHMDASEIQCSVPPSSTMGMADVTVTVTCCDGPGGDSFSDTLANGISYTNSLTARLQDVTPTSGSAGGGEMVTITGENLPSNGEDVHIEFGGVPCAIQTISATSVTCLTSPHNPEEVEVTLFVAMQGNAVVPPEGLLFTYVLEVQDISPCIGSVFGGQTVEITGSGFGMNASAVEVSFGQTVCSVSDVTDTAITCTTQSAATTHYVNNSGSSPEYGLGYRWLPDALVIHVGDTVEWFWTGTAFAQWRNVAQVSSDTATEYSGHGFRSESAVTGRFSFTFHTPGTFHYIAEGLAHIGMRGIVMVLPIEDINGAVEVSVSGIPAEFAESFNCTQSCIGGDPPADEIGYMFGTCHTPLIVAVEPSTVGPGDEVVVRMQGVSAEATENLIVVAGMACNTSNASLQGDVDVASELAAVASPPTNLTDSVITCMLPPSIPPGSYWVGLFVKGLGFGYAHGNNSQLQVKPTVVAQSVQPKFGSLRGGTQVTLMGKGFHTDPLKNRVTIGSTSCIPINVVQDNELTCITQAAGGDGYSSVVAQSEAIGYWTMQAVYWSSSGEYLYHDYPSIHNHGTNGQESNGMVVGSSVVGSQLGISGNAQTDQSVQISSGHIGVPYSAVLNNPLDFTLEFWLRINDGTVSFASDYSTTPAYRIIVSSFEQIEGSNRGYLVVLNPCNEWEIWSGTGETNPEAVPIGACGLVNASTCMESCSDLLFVPNDSNLPSGLWTVIRGPAFDVATTNWSHITVVWTANGERLPSQRLGLPSNEIKEDLLSRETCYNTSTGIPTCTGTWSLYVNGIREESVTANYTSACAGNLLIGGSELTTPSADGVLAQFTGFIDEVAVYGRELSMLEIADHYKFGTTEEQPVSVEVEGVVLSRTDTFSHLSLTELEIADIDWDTSPANPAMMISAPTIIRFSWTGLHGIYQVTQSAFESCDLEEGLIKPWSTGRFGGNVSIALETSQTSYFIDSVPGNCQNGIKLSVQYGNEHIVEWGLGRVYEDVIISSGTSLLFKWPGTDSSTSGIRHNVVELRSVPSMGVCDFISSDSGQIEKEWQLEPTSAGNLYVTGLSEGEHIFVCTVSGHCNAGMHIKVVVSGDSTGTVREQAEGTTHLEPTTHTVFWRIQEYPTLEIYDRDSVQFIWHAFHSLHQVTEESFNLCGRGSPPLHEWGLPGVDTAVTVPHIAPGVYYYICGVAGHCDAGMKIRVVVYPRPALPPLSTPIHATCHECVFSYSIDATPRLSSVNPHHAAGHSTLQLTGEGFLDDGDSATGVTVWVGKVPCSSITVNATSPETIDCILLDYESGFYHVDVHIAGKGLASVRDNGALVPGPHRNVTEAARMDSPYPVFFLAASVSGVSPSVGSLMGGTVVTISGSGFSLIPSRVSVTLGNFACDVIESSTASITCITSGTGADEESSVNAPVNVYINNFPASSTVEFTYAASATPSIENVTHANPKVGARDILTITGQDLSGATVTVKLLQFGELFGASTSVCNTMSVSATEIACIVPELSAGLYKVVVQVSDKGYSKEASDGAADIEYELSVDSFSPLSGGNGGGLRLTIRGSGFSSILSDSFTITVCDNECNIVSSTYSSVSCILAANAVTDPTSEGTSCSVNVTSNEVSVSAVDQFTFSAQLTPTIDYFTPDSGGTAGGTILEIIGNGFWPEGVTSADQLTSSNLTVTIDGAPCDWSQQSLLPDATSIRCRTSSHRTTLDAQVEVFVDGKGKAVYPVGPITYKYVDRWSSPFTWGGMHPPAKGESVYIQAGQTVLLDTSTPVLNLVLIEGELIFEDEQDVSLDARYIFINTGKLQVGTEEAPFTHRATITLHGTISDPEIPVYGAKVLAVRQGQLDLHGLPRNVTWTRLESTAERNATTLHLQDAVDWVQGDSIVVAPTGKDGNETEEHIVQSVQDGGHTVVLESPLAYTHFGITETFEDGQFIDIRAEVGLLSHNVIVQGSMITKEPGFSGQGGDMYGAQILIHRAGPNPTPIRIEHTEARHMGQAFRLGRYAIHFHLSGTMNGSYVKNCAIHHSFNRALTAHGIHDLLVEGNVAYDIMGHTYFVEDGIETNNRYIHNLGVLTRGSSSLLNTDQIPATFWITNPQNIFIDNAAVASRAYGYWYDLDDNPAGPSFTRNVCPNKEPFGTFENNVAHTCSEFGLRIWETYVPYEDGCSATVRGTAKLYNLTTYNNGIHGVEFSVVGHIQIIGFKISDNRDNGIEIQETHGDWGGPLIADTLVISHTSANSGSAGTGGIKTPNTPGLTISNVTFVNFNLPGTSCLRACSHCKVFQGGFQVWFSNITFLGNSSRNKAAFQWEHEVLYWDQDGTLSGVQGGWVLPNSALHPPQYCQQSVPELSAGHYSGAVCTSDVYFLRMAWNQAEPLVTLRVNVNVTNEFGSSIVPWRHYRLTHLDGYMLVLPAGYEHSIVWLLPPDDMVDTTSYSAGVYAVRPQDWALITHEFVTTPDHVEVGGTFEGLNGVPTEVDPNFSWFLDNTTDPEQVTYLVNGVNQTSSIKNYVFTYSYEACPRSGCPQPEVDIAPLEAGYRLWSNESSWPDGILPAEGDDVTIEVSWRMLLDISPPPLGTIYVFGELKFHDQDVNFTANTILVRGPNGALTVGEENDPFQNRAVITLTGRRGEPDLALARTMNLGSKALGIFSNVSLVGRPVNMQWTNLRDTAMSGTNTITLKGPPYPDWAVGDEIVIASSSYDPYEAEVRTISSISGGSITMHEPLQHTHTVSWMIPPEELTGSHIEDGVRMYPEVGLLTRNIVVQGGDSPEEPLEYHHYGCRVLIGQYSYDNFEFTGQAHFDSVEFRYCGQGGYFSPRDPRYSIAFKDLSDDSRGSYIRRCSIHHGYNTAIGVHRSNGLVLEDNVIYRTTDSSMKIGGSRNAALNNLALLTSTVQPNDPSDQHAVDFPATYEADATNELKNNVAAGSTRIGFRFTGEACTGDQQAVTQDAAQFWGNKAHSGLIGLVVLGLPAECTAIGGFTSYSNWDYGIFSSTASRLAVTDCTIASGKIGLNLNIFGPDPVAHRLGRKWIKIEKTLIVGLVEDEECISSVPAHAPRVSQSAREHKLGIMMSSFNKKRSKMDGTGAWHKMKGYPVIDGRVEATNVTFARFFSPTNCPYNVFAIGNNPLSPDAVHPMEMRQTGKINVNRDNIAFYYEPNPAWIVQEDCIDMDCDGPKHALVRDVDGQLLGSSPREGSIVPFAELRFMLNRVPSPWLAYPGPDTYRSPEEVVEGRGIARGTHGDTTSIPGGCVWVESWHAYYCAGLQHHMLVIESMDADTEVRRLSPLALNGGDTGGGHYTDLLNGPMDHGWCTYYTCLKRLSTFFSIVVVGSEYHIWLTGTNPAGLRFHLLNADADDAVILHIWYQNALRKDVYRNGIFIEGSNVQYTMEGAIFEESDVSFLPTFANHNGFNYFDRDAQMLHLLVKGEDPVEIRTPPVIQVSLNLAVPVDTFFDPRGILMNLAFVLRIDINTIRLVNVIAEDSDMRRKRQAVDGVTNDTMVVIEIGNLPENISAPDVTAVSDQVAKYGNESVDLGAGEQADLTNGTGIPGTGVEPTIVSNTTDNFNEDPPSDFEAAYEEERVKYNEATQDYMNAVNEAAEINQIANDIAVLVQTGQFEIENTTVQGVNITVAQAQPPPVPPVIPPEFNNTVSNPVMPVEEYQPVQSGDSDTEVEIKVPVELVVVRQPPTTSGHLVYVIVEARDSAGDVVTHLGITDPWTCQAVVQGGARDDSGGLPTIGGVTSVAFYDGRAHFTRLRINEPSSGVTLQFTSNPKNLVTTSSSFAIMFPPAETPRQRVHFELSGNVNAILNSEVSFAEVVQNALAPFLDVDLSRVQNVEVITTSGIVIEVDILERADTAPPDAPTLDSALATMRQHINMGNFSVTYQNQVYTSTKGSYREGPAAKPLPITTIILIVVISVLGLVLLVVVVFAVIYFCRRWRGKRPGSRKNKVATSSEAIELQASSGNLLEVTEDAGIVYYRNADCEVEWPSEAEDVDLKAPSTTSFSAMLGEHSDSSSMTRPSFLDDGPQEWNIRATPEARLIQVAPYKPE